MVYNCDMVELSDLLSEAAKKFRELEKQLPFLSIAITHDTYR